MLLVSPPNVTIDPNTITTKLYGTITFTCSAVGFGDFSFEWLSPNFDRTYERFLTIDSVLPRHQGQYKCTVTSLYSNLSSYGLATLNVQGNHEHTYFTFHFAVLPSTII